MKRKEGPQNICDEPLGDASHFEIHTEEELFHRWRIVEESGMARFYRHSAKQLTNSLLRLSERWDLLSALLLLRWERRVFSLIWCVEDTLMTLRTSKLLCHRRCEYADAMLHFLHGFWVLSSWIGGNFLKEFLRGQGFVVSAFVQVFFIVSAFTKC